MIKLYYRQGCAPCQTLKYFLNKKNIGYKEIDLDLNPHLPFLAPTLKIGEELIEGLNFPRLVEMLKTVETA